MTHAMHVAEHGTEGRGTRVPAVVLLCALAALVCGISACAHTEAATVIVLPPLDVPPAPPRVVEASEPPPPPVIALPDEPPTNLRPRPTPTQRPESPRSPEPTRAEQAAEPPKPAEEPRNTPATTLQTTPTQQEAEVERRVRVLIVRATADLAKVDYQALNADAKNQYDTAKRFALQAEDAIRARNLVFASNLADKAAALAAQLLGR